MTDPWAGFTDDDFRLFDRVARSLRKRAQGLMDFDDLYQSAALFALEHKAKYEAKRENERYAFTMVRNHLGDLIRQEKAKREGYEVDDEFFYTPKMLKEIVPMIFDPTWMEQSQEYDTDQGGKSGEPGDPAGAWVIVADVKRVFPKLKDQDRLLLYRTLAGPGEYVQVTKDIAAESGVTPKRVQDEVRNALVRLGRLLRSN